MRFLIRHLGNMGDLIFIVPPILASLKKKYPHCHITFVTSWGYKDKYGRWGNRNQGGHSLHLIMTNPHIEQLIHWHDTKTSLAAHICFEDGHSFPTWSRQYYYQQKKSQHFNGIFELDFGLKNNDNPIQRAYSVIGLPNTKYTNYRLYLTNHDIKIAGRVVENYPRPLIFLAEGLFDKTTRGWDPAKINDLERQIAQQYNVKPVWLGSKFIPEYEGRPLTLRENIATLSQADVTIGPLSGPLHFAAAVKCPTLILYCDHPIPRAAPAFFLNPYISNKKKLHRTLLGPDNQPKYNLKNPHAPTCLTPNELKRQGYKHWSKPGKQSTKSCLSVITVNEIMSVLKDII